jgi:hypothetical protein
MKTRELNAVQSSCESEQPFRILMIYDSSRSRAEAQHATGIILRELGDDISVNRSHWDLDSLAAAPAQAARDAAEADVIVLALSESTPAEPLREWISQWETTRAQRGGLIALIPSGSSESGGGLAELLYETAVTANMDFLCRKNRRTH